MKKILSLLVIVCVLALPAFAGLAFTNDSTNRLDCGSPAALDNLNTGTVIAKIFITSHSGSNDGAIIAKTNAGFTIEKQFVVQNNGALLFQIQRATDPLFVEADVGAFTLGEWNTVAVSWSTAGADGDQHVYIGTQAVPIADVTFGGDAGVGAVTDDSAVNFGIGNMASGSVFLGGGTRRIAWVQIWNRQLTLAEIRQQQFWPRRTVGSLGLWHLGFNGTGTHPDYSGNGNSCTVTGATVADHAPDGSIFSL